MVKPNWFCWYAHNLPALMACLSAIFSSSRWLIWSTLSWSKLNGLITTDHWLVGGRWVWQHRPTKHCYKYFDTYSDYRVSKIRKYIKVSIQKWDMYKACDMGWYIVLYILTLWHLTHGWKIMEIKLRVYTFIYIYIYLQQQISNPRLYQRYDFGGGCFGSCNIGFKISARFWNALTWVRLGQHVLHELYYKYIYIYASCLFDRKAVLRYTTIYHRYTWPLVWSITVPWKPCMAHISATMVYIRYYIHVYLYIHNVTQKKNKTDFIPCIYMSQGVVESDGRDLFHESLYYKTKLFFSKLMGVVSTVISRDTLEGFSKRVFIFTNPRNFLVDQLSFTTWSPSDSFDCSRYNWCIWSRSGSTRGCGVPSVEAMRIKSGVRKPAMCGFDAAFTDSVVPSANSTAPSCLSHCRTEGVLSHSEHKSFRSSWGFSNPVPTSSELILVPFKKPGYGPNVSGNMGDLWAVLNHVEQPMVHHWNDAIFTWWLFFYIYIPVVYR